MLKIKRVYEPREVSDGKRVLLDRLWPRGLSRETAGIDEWIKELSPSEGLRKWFGHEPDKWPEVRRRYIEELSTAAKQSLLKRIAEMASQGDVTIVYGARDTEHNNAVVLHELITQLTKQKALA